ncbi:transketolase-like TK C-terminal-containing protein [Rhodococcus wratislaviensis]|uniref:transketolase-like TK C-terminal-containing protein n=1 Tax=Rhodococcus wratislaviensis TaxID=44752 RepID=UPI0036640595
MWNDNHISIEDDTNIGSDRENVAALPAAPAALLGRLSTRTLPAGWDDAPPSFPADATGMATRKASGTVLSVLAPELPELWLGSADLAESNKTNLPVSRRSSRRRPARRRQRTAVAWRTILTNSDRPAGLALTRQNVPTWDRTVHGSAEGTARGGYILAEGENGEPDHIIIATPWREFVGDAGEIVSLEHFGASASGPELFERFGFTVDRLVHAARTTLARTTTARRAPVTTSL